LKVELEKCSGHDYCMDKPLIDKQFQDVIIEFPMVNKVIDLAATDNYDDKKDAVVSVYNDREFFRLSATSEIKVDMYLRYGSAYLYSDKMVFREALAGVEPVNFFSLGPIVRRDEEMNETSLLGVVLRLDYSADIYKRNVYDVQQWVIDTSSVSRVIFYLGMFLSQHIALKLYKSEIISDLFLTETPSSSLKISTKDGVSRASVSKSAL
jgi:hypothetical protein